MYECACACARGVGVGVAASEYVDVAGLGRSVDVGDSGVVVRPLEADTDADADADVDVGVGSDASPPAGWPGTGAERGAVYAPSCSCSCTLLCGGETVMIGRAEARLSVLRRLDSDDPLGLRSCRF